MANEKKAIDPAPGGSYEVGYRKPPKRTRFQPGQSGNPRGRPKGTNNLKTDLMEELREKVLIREGDRSQKVSKQRALLKSVLNRAIKGDARAIGIALSTMMRLLETGEGAPAVEEPLLDDERDILGAFAERARRGVQRDAAAPASRRDASEDES